MWWIKVLPEFDIILYLICASVFEKLLSALKRKKIALKIIYTFGIFQNIFTINENKWSLREDEKNFQQVSWIYTIKMRLGNYLWNQMLETIRSIANIMTS